MDLRTQANSGGDMKQEHKRRERESNGKTATGNSGRREQAKQQWSEARTQAVATGWA